MMTYEQKLAKVLDVMGGLYLVRDIEARMHEGRMQGFVVNNTWAITETQQFPRARKLNILAVVGDLKDIDELHERIIEYANQNGFGLISAIGRKGWIDEAKRKGWRLKAKSYLYQKEL